MPQAVHLTYEDFLQAALSGAMRQSRACKRGRVGSDHDGSSGRDVSQRLADSVVGEIGEAAVSKALGVPRTRGGEHVTIGDLGRIEVRATEREGGRLIVYESEGPETPFVLVVVGFAESGVRCDIKGWMWAGEAQQDTYRESGDPPCYWVPQRDLRPLSKLQGQVLPHA